MHRLFSRTFGGNRVIVEAKLPEITVGQMLVMRDELQTVAKSDRHPVGDRLRSSKLVQVLDELIERRRKDADAAETR